MATEVVYLGLKINRNDIQPVPEKVVAIEEMPHPSDVKELQAYLGMLNYYSRFLPRLATVLAPLYHLLKKRGEVDMVYPTGAGMVRIKEAASVTTSSRSL